MSGDPREFSTAVCSANVAVRVRRPPFLAIGGSNWLSRRSDSPDGLSSHRTRDATGQSDGRRVPGTARTEAGSEFDVVKMVGLQHVVPACHDRTDTNWCPWYRWKSGISRFVYLRRCASAPGQRIMRTNRGFWRSRCRCRHACNLQWHRSFRALSILGTILAGT